MNKPRPKLAYEPPSIKSPFPEQGKALPPVLGGTVVPTDCTNGTGNLTCNIGAGPGTVNCSSGSSPAGGCTNGQYVVADCFQGGAAQGGCTEGTTPDACMSGTGPIDNCFVGDNAQACGTGGIAAVEPQCQQGAFDVPACWGGGGPF